MPRVVCSRLCFLPWPRPNTARVRRLALSRLGLDRLALAFEDRLAARQSCQTRCVGFSQSGSASPQRPCSRPPHFRRHSWPSGRSGVRAGTKHGSPAAQGVVRTPSARCVLGVCVLAAATTAVGMRYCCIYLAQEQHQSEVLY